MRCRSCDVRSPGRGPRCESQGRSYYCTGSDGPSKGHGASWIKSKNGRNVDELVNRALLQLSNQAITGFSTYPRVLAAAHVGPRLTVNSDVVRHMPGKAAAAGSTSNLFDFDQLPKALRGTFNRRSSSWAPQRPFLTGRRALDDRESSFSALAGQTRRSWQDLKPIVSSRSDRKRRHQATTLHRFQRKTIKATGSFQSSGTGQGCRERANVSQRSDGSLLETTTRMSRGLGHGMPWCCSNI